MNIFNKRSYIIIIPGGELTVGTPQLKQSEKVVSLKFLILSYVQYEVSKHQKAQYCV